MSGMATATVVAGGLSYMAGQGASKAAKKASKKQLAAQREAGFENQKQYNAITNMLSPYSEAATGSVGGQFDAAQYLRDNPDVASNAYWGADPLRHYNEKGRAEGRAMPTTKATTGALTEQRAMMGLLGADAQQASISGIESSPYFQAVAQQGENAMLQNASATGGLRGGNTQGALAQFRPQLLNQLIQQRYSNLGGLVNVGQNAMAQQVNARGNQAAQSVNLLQGQGAIQAGGTLGQAAGNAQSMAGIGSAIGGLAGLFGGQKAPYTGAQGF
jgi:hypothetical protein